jgi:PAS domain S-box-containing protein
MKQHSWRIERDPYVRTIFRQLPGALWTTDRNLRLMYVAGRLANQAEPVATPGMTLFDVLGTDDPTHPIVAYHRAALFGDPQSFEHQFRGRWYELSIEQLTSEGRIVGCIGTAFDITEHRAIRERLTRSEKLLAQAQRLAHVGSFEWDIKSNVVTWSDELHRIHGAEPGQFQGTYEAFLERVHPDDVEATKNAILEALRTMSPFAYEHRIIRPDGTVRTVHSQGEVVSDTESRPTVAAGCCWDVTELHEAMEKLKGTTSLLEATIESTADGLLVVDVEGKVTAYNRRFLALWRIPPELAQENDDKKLLDYVCDQLEDPDRFMCTTRDLYSHPERESFDVLHFKDGRVFERYSIPQRVGDQIVGRVWSFRDITEREKLFRRALFLADATRLLSSLEIEPALESVAHLAIPYMGDGCAVDLLGDGEPRRLLVVSREGTEAFSPELPSAVMAGHSVIYSLGARSCMAVPLVIKTEVVGAMTFIGRQRRRYTQQDLEFAESLARRAALAVENARLYRSARDAIQARDEFLAIAAHEIRGPITSVHLAVQGLQKGKVPPGAESRVLDIIEREDRRLAQFVEELLDLGRIQAGQMYFNFEDVDLAGVVRETAGNLNHEIVKSGSSLSITTSGRTVGHWDKFRLTQVVVNLLSNAIKFGQGKPIAVVVTEYEGVTTLEVRDEGIGIAPEMLDQVFKPFERAVSVRHYGGLGLGLFIVQTIVNALGGTIRVKSKPGVGSTFTVELRNARTR